MNGAQASHLYSAHVANAKLRGVGVRVVTVEAYPVMGGEGDNSADLGRSSTYSSENLEGRSG
jgi:hypothetical protein